MATTQTRLPFWLSIVRALAQIQFIASALGLGLYGFFGLVSLQRGSDRPAVTLEIRHPRQGQVTPAGYDSLGTSPIRYPHQLVPISSKVALVYREHSLSKRVGLLLLGMTNHAADRSSLPLLVYSMLTGLIIYRILRDTRLESPFTEVNARRIRWLGLLMIGLDGYQYLGLLYLHSIVPPLQVPGRSGTVTRYLVLDPAADFGSWKFGLVLLVVAAVYQRGVVMAREAELTI